MILKEEILNNWKTDIQGCAQILPGTLETGYPAWTVKIEDEYGVAILYEGTEDINESFAKARIRSTTMMFEKDLNRRVIILTTNAEDIRMPFAVLCEAFVDPGAEGETRRIIVDSPVGWWKEWKELLGNKNIDERVYDVLGELCVLKYAIINEENPEWNGPDGASYDIETQSRFLEVKSTLSRDKNEVTISNQFQLDPPGKQLCLIFCRFEPSIYLGLSIDDMLIQFEELGYNPTVLNQKIESRGLEKGMSARKKKFILHEMLLYNVDHSFPRLSPSSFVGGTLPAGIVKLAYTVDLSAIPSISIMPGEKNDI